MNKLLDKIYPHSNRIIITIFLVALIASFCPHLEEVFLLFKYAKNALYPQILVSLSIFFGFILASISLIISISNNPIFLEFRNKNKSAENIWDSFIKALKYLGLGCIISLLLIVVDGQKSNANIIFVSTVRWIAIFIYLKITEKLFWAFILLYLLIETIKKKWKKDRKAYLENLTNEQKAKKKD